MAAQPDRATVTWSTPECPFSIECSIRVLDDIRLAVTDAFFSLPRGGAEIGGILLGAWQEGRLTISDYAALDCEHALGPSFTLSLGDETRLQELIRAASASGAGRVVGWYHSHTRTGVLLSDTDLTIHNRFFPDPWQVALVVKPHTFEPMRAGFFFRGSGGIIHCSASYREFPIETVPMRQVPRAVPAEPPAQPPHRPASARPIVDVHAEPEAPPPPPAPIVNVRAEPESPPPAPAPPIVDFRTERAATAAPQAHMPETAPEAQPAAPAQLPIPSMFEQSQERSWGWLKVVLPVGLVLAAGVAAYVERDVWYPAAASLLQQAPPPINAASIALNTVDEAGQLQIRWDPSSTLVRTATGASLEITDGDPPPNIVPLDVRHLASGVFTYGRRNKRVDVTLVLDQPSGTTVRQVTSFLGQEPPAPVMANPPQPNKDSEEMARVVAGLRAQLDAEREHTRKIEKELATARAQLREQQLRRLSNQARPLEH
jgi:proteasome lid subunit RPN8/RPN11